MINPRAIWLPRDPRLAPPVLPLLRFTLAGLVLVFTVPVSRAQAAPPPANVVLVHGILDTGKIFAPMERVLEEQGCRCFAPSLTPNDCRLGVHALARQLSDRIDARFGPTAPLVLVGFSMGGIVTRDYVQNLARAHRVRAVFLISTPERGTWWASLAPGDGVHQLGLHSRFIQALDRNPSAWRHVPVRSYWTPCDLMILPATSSLWPVGSTRKIFCLLHPWMVRNRTLIADLSACITALQAGEPLLGLNKAAPPGNQTLTFPLQ